MNKLFNIKPKKRNIKNTLSKIDEYDSMPDHKKEEVEKIMIEVLGLTIEKREELKKQYNEERRIKAAIYRENNKERIRALKRKWYLKNKRKKNEKKQ